MEVNRISNDGERSLDADNWLQDLQLDGKWMAAINDSQVTQDTIVARTPALSTVPDIPITPDGPVEQLLIQPGCKCNDYSHLYENWPSRDAELIIGTCMRQCPYCRKNFSMPFGLR